jgi:LPXTG-motif cell wall-anchored protein
VQLVVGDSDGTQVDAARQGLIAVAGVFGRTSDTSVFAPSSRAVVQVLPAQVPPTDPPVTTAPMTAPTTTAAPGTTVAPVTTATPTTLAPAPAPTSTTVPAASPATPPPTTAPIRRLPSTGGESGLQMRLAMGLTATGALLVALSRRRGRVV